MNITEAKGYIRAAEGIKAHSRPVKVTEENIHALKAPRNIHRNLRLRNKREIEALYKTIPPSVTQLKEMSVEETVGWIKNLGNLRKWEDSDTCEIAKQLRKEEINGSKLVKFGQHDLKKIKIRKAGLRMAIVKSIMLLQTRATAAKKQRNKKVIMDKFWAQLNASDHGRTNLLLGMSETEPRVGRRKKKSKKSRYRRSISDGCLSGHESQLPKNKQRETTSSSISIGNRKTDFWGPYAVGAANEKRNQLMVTAPIV